MLLLQQEGTPVLGGQGSHFNSMVAVKSVHLGQRRLGVGYRWSKGQQSQKDTLRVRKSPARALVNTQVSVDI